jgi:hypothetical protein
MDRLIALLAALVGLIALGGALLVHNSATAVMERQAAEIAALKASLTLISQQAPAAPSPRSESVPADRADDGTAEALLALQSRIVTLENTTKAQATELTAAREALANAPALAPPTQVAITSEQPVSSDAPAALSSDGPTTDCIPLGTRFMAQAGDSFPICKTKVVVEVSAVTETSALVTGAGPVAAGGFANLPAQGCTIMVFSADTSGFAEMRVSCV